jgi:hypothetical protein
LNWYPTDILDLSIPTFTDKRYAPGHFTFSKITSFGMEEVLKIQVGDIVEVCCNDFNKYALIMKIIRTPSQAPGWHVLLAFVDIANEKEDILFPIKFANKITGDSGPSPVHVKRVLGSVLDNPLAEVIWMRVAKQLSIVDPK